MSDDGILNLSNIVALQEWALPQGDVVTGNGLQALRSWMHSTNRHRNSFPAELDTAWCFRHKRLYRINLQRRIRSGMTYRYGSKAFKEIIKAKMN